MNNNHTLQLEQKNIFRHTQQKALDKFGQDGWGYDKNRCVQLAATFVKTNQACISDYKGLN